MKIGVRGGHTELCGGAVGIINELTEDRKVKDLVISKLRKLGHEVVDCTPPVNYTSNQSTDLRYGTDKCNSTGCELFVSIHFNNCYNTYNGALGSEVCVYSTFDTAQRVVNELSALGFKNRGQKVMPGLHDVRSPKCKAMIIECCFVEATKDVEVYKRVGAEGVANAIVKGLVGKTVTTTSKTSNTTANTSNGFSQTVKDFQTQFNMTYGKTLVEDGLWGPNTEAALHKVLLKIGSNNSLVGFIQCRVGANVDYQFGPNTKAKVIEYQRNHGLSADGIVGFNTIKCILNQYK